MTVGFTRRATTNELRATERLAAATVDQRAGLAGPNKPIVATAHTPRNEYALGAGRRHIGQPFGTFGERQVAAWQRTRSTNCTE